MLLRVGRVGLPSPRRLATSDALAVWLSGATYADWDPRQLDRQFTTSTGPTNVASNGDAVGLLIGGSQLGGLTVPAYLAAAAEMVTNGGFSVDANWTKGTGWTIAAGVATHGGGSAGTLSQAISITAGRLLRVEFTVSGRTASSVTPNLTGGSTINGTAVSSNGTTTQYLLSVSGNNTINFTTGASFDGSIDNVSCKEIPGYHALQSTSGDRPQYQSGYLRGDGSSDNLLTTWVCGASANTLIYKWVTPAASGNKLSGLFGATDGRFFLGMNNAGIIAGGVGTQTLNTIVGTTSIASSTVVIALTEDGSTVSMFCYKAGSVTQEYSAARNGAPTTTIPLRIGATNGNGTAGSWSNGDIGRMLAAQKAMTLAEFTAIAPLLAA